MINCFSFVKEHKVETAIFFLALVVRLIYFGLSYSANDSNLVATINAGDGYYEIAQNLLDGNGFSISNEPPFIPTSYRTPGMPYFIAGINVLFGGYLSVIIVLIVLGSLVPLIGMRIARYLSSRSAIIVSVGVFLALEPTGVLLSTVLLSETLFTVFFLLSILFLFWFWKNKEISALGISAFLLGIATLVRPPVEYLPIAIGALIIWEARDKLSRSVFVHAGIYLLIFLATLSPWVFRNYQEFGVIGISSQRGAALYAIAIPSLLAVENKVNFSDVYNHELAGPNYTSFAQSAEYSKMAIPILLEHPRSLALLSLNTSFSFFTYDGVYDFLRRIKFDGDMYNVLHQTKKESGIQPGSPVLLAVLSSPTVVVKFISALFATPLIIVLIDRTFWFLILAAFLFGVYRFLRVSQKDIYTLTAIIVVLYTMLTTLIVGFTVNYRYRLPVNVFIFSIAVIEIVALSPLMRRRVSVLTE